MISRYLSRSLLPQVREQPAPLADELQKPASGIVVLGMALEVLRQLLNALCEKRDLHLRPSCILFIRTECFHDFFLDLLS